MAICKTCGKPGAPQRGGPCAACLAPPRAPFKPSNKERERAERRGRAEGLRTAQTHIEQFQSKIQGQLEAQADKILEADRDKSAQILAEITALRECYETLKMPSNDPEYLKTLQATETARSEIANKVQMIHIVPDGPDKTWVAVGLADPRNKAEAHDVARRMAEHFEAKIRSHEPEETTP